MKYHSDVLILGAGAAGLMCAIEAGKRGRSVTVLESSNRAGQKILISGGGRCNFTNLGSAPENFISGNPHFAKSALARYTPENFVAMVERHCIAWHEKKLGQLFCDRSAQDILTMLEEECVRVGVRVKLSAKVKEVRHAGQFTAITGEHEFASDALVVATGGLSIPKMGATAFGYELARQFGLKVVEPRPALVAFTEPGRHKAFLRSDRALYRGGCQRRQGKFPGEAADYAPWFQRPGNSANLFVLEAGRESHAGYGAGSAGICASIGFRSSA